MSQPPTDPTPDRVSLHRLRLLVAGVCKDLMRARLSAQPTAFTPTELDAWGIAVGAPPCPSWRYLLSAASNVGLLLTDFGPEYLGSSLGHPDHEPPEQRVIRGCEDLLAGDGDERPDAFLRRLVGRVRRGSGAGWWDQLCWGELNNLREQLNLLPEGEEPSRQRLRWDSATGRLYLDGEQVLSLTKRATNLRKFLDHFQAARWAYSVTLPDTRDADKRRSSWVEDVVKVLNKRQTRIQFFGDGSGDGVYYQILEPDTRSA